MMDVIAEEYAREAVETWSWNPCDEISLGAVITERCDSSKRIVRWILPQDRCLLYSVCPYLKVVKTAYWILSWGTSSGVQSLGQQSFIRNTAERISWPSHMKFLIYPVLFYSVYFSPRHIHATIQPDEETRSRKLILSGPVIQTREAQWQWSICFDTRIIKKWYVEITIRIKSVYPFFFSDIWVKTCNGNFHDSLLIHIRIYSPTIIEIEHVSLLWYFECLSMTCIVCVDLFAGQLRMTALSVV